MVSAYFLIFSLNHSYISVKLIFFKDFLRLIATIKPIIIPMIGLEKRLAVIIKDPIPKTPLSVPLLNLSLFLSLVYDFAKDTNEIINNIGLAPNTPATTNDDAKSANSSFSLFFHWSLHIFY